MFCTYKQKIYLGESALLSIQLYAQSSSLQIKIIGIKSTKVCNLIKVCCQTDWSLVYVALKMM